MNRVEQQMEATIAKKAEGTGALRQSVRNKVAKSGVGAAGELMFKEYGRWLDMGVRPGHPLGGLRLRSETLKASKKTGFSQTRRRKVKPVKIYSKVAYGNLKFLINDLLYGYTEQVINDTKQTLENGN